MRETKRSVTEFLSLLELFFGGVKGNGNINQHMQEIYGIEVSAEWVSKITDKILPRIKEWQNRALQALYPIVYMDAIFLSVREEGMWLRKLSI